jgi:hypothetical protein
MCIVSCVSLDDREGASISKIERPGGWCLLLFSEHMVKLVHNSM